MNLRPPAPRRTDRRGTSRFSASRFPVSRLSIALRAAITATLATLATAVILIGAASPGVAEPGWVAPVSPISILSKFSPPEQRWLAGHRGVDLAVIPGQSVRAAGAGRVTFTGNIAGRGVVTVTHGELRTTYEPVESSVVTGQTVSRGQVIGVIGSGGHCDLRCLHWGLLRGDTYLDPMLLLTGKPPVLKVPTSTRMTVHDVPATGRVGNPRSSWESAPGNTVPAETAHVGPDIGTAADSDRPIEGSSGSSDRDASNRSTVALAGVGAVAGVGMLGGVAFQRRRRFAARAPT